MFERAHCPSEAFGLFRFGDGFSARRRAESRQLLPLTTDENAPSSIRIVENADRRGFVTRTTTA